MDFEASLEQALALDAADAFARFRGEISAGPSSCIDLRHASAVGPACIAVDPSNQTAVQSLKIDQAGIDGMDWFEAYRRARSKIAALIGAQPAEVALIEPAQANLLVTAAAVLRLQPGRRTLLSDSLSDPRHRFILQSLPDLAAPQYRLLLAQSMDDVSMANAAIPSLISSDTAVVFLSHVTPDSGFMYSMERITSAAHSVETPVLWDLSHSAGAVPLNLNAAGVDLAIGCGDRYLNGGPGAPAFVYARRGLQARLPLPLRGWFEVDPDGMNNGLTATGHRLPPMASLLAFESGLDLLARVGVSSLRASSVLQSEFLLTLAQAWLALLGGALASPLQPDRRGAHIALRHPAASRIARALAAGDDSGARVLLDYRPPDILRIGPSPLHTRYADIYHAMELLRRALVR